MHILVIAHGSGFDVPPAAGRSEYGAVEELERRHVSPAYIPALLREARQNEGHAILVPLCATDPRIPRSALHESAR